MQVLEKEKISKIKGIKLDSSESFNFGCHKGLDCYTRCCQNTNIFLSPYDIVKLKKSLGISSEEFLDKYTDIILREGNYFPDVLLKMHEDNLYCPFLNNNGCKVYEARPDACRCLPIEQGVMFHSTNTKSNLYFFRPPDFCMGIYESKEWTVELWLKDQDVDTYNIKICWGEFKALFKNNPWASEGPYGPKGKMAFMAIYNTDSFKKFIFQSSFLKRYRVKKSVLKKIKANEIYLIKFALNWVKFFLFGISSKNFKPG